MRLADKYHDVERLLRKMVTASLILSQIRMDSIQFESAQQRYHEQREQTAFDRQEKIQCKKTFNWV